VPTQAFKVVILLATFNGADYIAEQLASFAAQSYEDWELLVSDDGSSDRTVEIIREFAEGRPQRIRLVEGPRQGFWRNFLFLTRLAAESAGDLFAFSDQDDIWLPTKIQRAVDWFANEPSDVPRLYFTRTQLIGEHAESLGWSPLFKRKPSFQNALVQNIGGGNTMVLNRTAGSLLSATPRNVSLVAHDWWTYQMVTGAGGLAFYDPRPSVSYRQHGGNLIGSNRGLRQRLNRLFAFTNSRVVQWNDTNINALNNMRDLLSAKNLDALDLFCQARTAALPRKLYLLWRSGVYRQNVVETVGVYIGSIFHLI
jgi:glycosyltransferase involved in cell wall biosynthesis